MFYYVQKGRYCTDVVFWNRGIFLEVPLGVSEELFYRKRNMVYV